jgi:hypothetical protein
MPAPLKPNPIYVDYQPVTHGFASKPARTGTSGRVAEGLTELMVWALSTFLFLATTYVISEAPFAGRQPGREARSTTADRNGQEMSRHRAEVRPASQARAGTIDRSVLR